MPPFGRWASRGGMGFTVAGALRSGAAGVLLCAVRRAACCCCWGLGVLFVLVWCWRRVSDACAPEVGLGVLGLLGRADAHTEATRSVAFTRRMRVDVFQGGGSGAPCVAIGRRVPVCWHGSGWCVLCIFVHAQNVQSMEESAAAALGSARRPSAVSTVRVLSFSSARGGSGQGWSYRSEEKVGAHF